MYRIVHRTEYVYDAPVSSSFGDVHLQPRTTTTQQCYSAAVTIEPFPEDYRERRDFFGNRAAHFNVREPHTTLVVTATSTVDVKRRPLGDAQALNQTWEQVQQRLRDDSDAETIEARQFALRSPSVPASPDAAKFAAPSFTPDRPILEAVADLNHRIYSEFEYAPGVTSVETTVEQVLQRRSGVCQDFAHVALAGLRSVGLAARYVSGYLETVPPPGEVRLTGADMSHAWVSVYVPAYGWVDIDPTNDQLVNDRYITVAWGRDYQDVAPLKGVIFTEAENHELIVTVDVVAVPDNDPDAAGI